MSDTDSFGSYLEAVNALSKVENRQREALRKAVESSTAIQEQAKAQIADQQRMYDRAAKDAKHAADLLAELRTMLGVPQVPTPIPTTHAGTPPQLVEIRGQIRNVMSWAEKTKPIAESLLRTRARLANAPKLVQPTPAPAPPHLVKARARKLPVGLIAPIAVLIIIVMVVIIVIVVNGN